MTLDEAIKHATEVADQQEAAGCHECSANHRQLAKWLTELKERREKDEQSSCSENPNRSDLISRQAAIDIERNATVDTNPSHFEAHQKFTQFMDDAEVSSFGRWQWSNGFNTALTAVGIDLKKLPSAQPEIIRCKDCGYGEQDEVGRWFCGNLGCQIGNEDGSGFCADAERRTDD